MRRLTEFSCAGETLLGTLDTAPGGTGLLIVSGGNELRCGAHRGMALLAQDVAAAGCPVFRFDRRGIGDSSGANGGFEESAEDIAAAAACFRREAGVARMLGFGICDGATALALFHRAAGIDALLLANPWIVASAPGLPPPAAIRARYRRRLGDPAAWLRLARGDIDLGRLARGLAQLVTPRATPPLALRFARALAESAVPARLLLARDDNTALAFGAVYAGPVFAALRPRVPVATCDTASHSFAGAAEKAWLRTQVLDALRDAASG